MALDDISRLLKNTNLKVDKFTDALLDLTKEVNGLKSQMFEYDVNYKNVKRDIAFTNERIDYLTKSNAKPIE
eukprot:CAMPEP_0116964052 /NCGR_PEP_ID=MMETSP0467-20121206/48313_1 /TAXON_ID=283647 /ORGANISM="Mesodinium pulex, Strain SPMC105" /LENGTH=71 /DNA_ID=CAMNT_0004652871 /DNA_START=901 /DNA_END=1116 /DNA_ORIENTATION=-